MSTRDLAEGILALEEGALHGALRTYGQWFGRPFDNNHRFLSAEVRGDLLTLSFEKGERLEVWSPSQLIIEGASLTIPKASRVRWSWLSYGRPKLPENWHQLEYLVVDGKVTRPGSSRWSRRPSQDGPAVELA